MAAKLCVYRCLCVYVCMYVCSQVSTNPGSAGQWLNVCCVSSIVMYHVCILLMYVCICVCVCVCVCVCAFVL